RRNGRRPSPRPPGRARRWRRPGGSRVSVPRAPRHPWPAGGQRSRSPGPGPEARARSARPGAAARRSTAAVLDPGPGLGAAGVQEAVGERAAEALGVVGRAAEALADQALAVEAGEEALDLEGPGVGRTGQGAGRERAGPAKAPEERPLGPQGDPRWAVGEGAEQAEGAGVVLAGLDGQGALPRGRDEHLRVERDGRLSGQAEAAQAGRGQDPPPPPRARARRGTAVA